MLGRKDLSWQMTSQKLVAASVIITGTAGWAVHDRCKTLSRWMLEEGTVYFPKINGYSLADYKTFVKTVTFHEKFDFSNTNLLPVHLQNSLQASSL